MSLWINFSMQVIGWKEKFAKQTFVRWRLTDLQITVRLEIWVIRSVTISATFWGYECYKLSSTANDLEDCSTSFLSVSLSDTYTRTAG